MFSGDYPYEQMDEGGRWFDDMRLSNKQKLKIGRNNANGLMKLGLPELATEVAAGFAS